MEKYSFIKLNNIVVDLGAAPGGWLQIARQIVGEKGFVLGIDKKEIMPLTYSNVHTIVEEIKDPNIVKRIKVILPGLADVVLSDLSPNVSGIWELDHPRQIELAEKSLNIAFSILNKKGNFLVKVFQGELFDEFRKKIKKGFRFSKIVKPKASRAKSAEIYLLGMDFKRKKSRINKEKNGENSPVL
jgi:23S rRNA (uridine2552-2'-O)-methyltransferase